MRLPSVLDVYLAGNPVWEAFEPRHRQTPISVLVLIGLVYACVLLAWLRALGIGVHELAPVPIFAVASLYGLAWFVTPGRAATAIAAERERGTLVWLLLSPHPRRPLLIGLLASRLRPLVESVTWCVPAFVVGGALVAVGEPSNTPPLERAILGAVIGLLQAAGVGVVMYFGAGVGAWAAVASASVTGALVRAYAILLAAPPLLCCGTSMVCGFVMAPVRVAGSEVLALLPVIAIVVAHVFAGAAFLRSAVDGMDRDDGLGA